MLHADRRVTERVNLARPCKVYDPASGRYLSGTMWNISDGGAYLELHRRIELRPEQRLCIGVAMKRRQTLLRSTEMLWAEVVRSLSTTDDRTGVGLRFIGETAQARPASNRAA